MWRSTETGRLASSRQMRSTIRRPTGGRAVPNGVGRNHAFAGVVGGKIYVIGGRVAHAFVTVSSNTDIVEEYDPATNTWSGLKAKMPSARSGGGWGTH